MSVLPFWPLPKPLFSVCACLYVCKFLTHTHLSHFKFFHEMKKEIRVFFHIWRSGDDGDDDVPPIQRKKRKEKRTHFLFVITVDVEKSPMNKDMEGRIVAVV